MKSKANYSYVGIAFIILIFGILFIPKIVNRFSEGDIVRNNESRSDKIAIQSDYKLSDLSFIEINGVPKKVPSFSFVNQNGKQILVQNMLEQNSMPNPLQLIKQCSPFQWCNDHGHSYSPHPPSH